MAPATAKPSKPFAYQAARTSFWAPFIAIGLGLLTMSTRTEYPKIGVGIGILNMLMVVVGLMLGVIALVAMRRHGRARILGYALAGVLINAAIIAITVTSVLVLVQLHRQVPMTEAELRALPTIYPGSTPVIDAKFGFRIEIPRGFSEVKAPGSGRLKPLCTFRRILADGKTMAIHVQAMGAVFNPDSHVTQADLRQTAKSFPPGATTSLGHAIWNGYRLGMIMVRTPVRGERLAVLVVQVPLIRDAIQIVVEAPASDLVRARATMRHLLRSLKGRSNWDFDPTAQSRRVGR